MELTGVTAQSIFDDNAADLKLSWVAGLEGADRAFDVDFAKEATSAADLVGHLNLIHPNRIQVLASPRSPTTSACPKKTASARWAS